MPNRRDDTVLNKKTLEQHQAEVWQKNKEYFLNTGLDEETSTLLADWSPTDAPDNLMTPEQREQEKQLTLKLSKEKQ